MLYLKTWTSTFHHQPSKIHIWEAIIIQRQIWIITTLGITTSTYPGQLWHSRQRQVWIITTLRITTPTCPGQIWHSRQRQAWIITTLLIATPTSPGQIWHSRQRQVWIMTTLLIATPTCPGQLWHSRQRQVWIMTTMDRHTYLSWTTLAFKTQPKWAVNLELSQKLELLLEEQTLHTAITNMASDCLKSHQSI